MFSQEPKLLVPASKAPDEVLGILKVTSVPISAVGIVRTSFTNNCNTETHSQVRSNIKSKVDQIQHSRVECHLSANKGQESKVRSVRYTQYRVRINLKAGKVKSVKVHPIPSANKGR